MRDRTDDAHAARRRANLVVACVFLLLNLAVLGALLPFLIGAVEDAVPAVPLEVHIPAHR